MKKEKLEKINTLATSMIAFSTIIGVGGALVYYFREFLDLSTNKTILSFFGYLLVCFLISWGFWRKIK